MTSIPKFIFNETNKIIKLKKKSEIIEFCFWELLLKRIVMISEIQKL